ncbi:hypothetical protein [Chryseobacterium paridis]|uniref:Uncharacterized protein n=1 Tax=Chryseobacterium paridis TaxID=2800328 RepID=A0ABS1FXU2_9FLAO|nr:hypothetical protein [Chryseobacterium paridis]MBK1897272.1 hypothetical protein [Chryseobacterium paridis]
MPKRIITELKSFFKAGKRPTQNQFEDFLDSYVHLDNPEFVKTEDVGSTRQGIAKFFTSSAGTDIFHIKLPYKVDTNSAMFHIKALGYAYHSGDPIDITWVGYCYRASTSLLNYKTFVNGSTSITAGQYVGTDKHIYLWFKLSSIYFSSFKLDSMRVGNGTLLKQGDVEIILSTQSQL